MAYWDFLQMTPENQAAARNMSWGQAIKSEIPGTSNYRGYNPFYKGADATGLGGYLKQGGQSLAGNFQAGSNVGGATPLMRKLAMSPVARGIGTIGRVAGLTNPVGAAATAAYFTPKLINKMTEREDPNITGMYGLNIRDLEKKAADYDYTGEGKMLGSTLDDWASPMGVIPGEEIQEQVTETTPNFYEQNIGTQPFPHGGFEEMDLSKTVTEPQKKSFNFPGIWSMLQGLGDKFQRPEAKQKEFEAYEASMNPQGWGDFGDYRGNIWEGSGGNKINVVDPGTGTTILQNKNFDSMFGSKSVEEMIAKKEAWARKRRAKGKEYLSTDMNAWLDAIDKGKGGADQTPKGPSGYTGPKTYDFDPGAFQRSGGQRPDKPGGFTDPGKGSYGPHKAQGGYMRSRYNQGGRVGILAAF